MLNRYEKTRDDSNFQIFNVVLFIFFFIVLFPVIPICLLLIILFYGVDKQKWANAFLYSYTAVVGIIAFIIFMFMKIDMLTMFSNEFINILKSNTENLLNLNFVSMLKSYFMYSLSSWYIVFIISHIPMVYFVYRMQLYKKRENAGVVNLDTNIEKINDNTVIEANIITKSDKETSTLIGYNKNRKDVYCADNAKHIFVAGTTGSGKTVLLSNFIKSGIAKNYGMFIVDGKGDLVAGSMLDITARFCEEYNRNLLVVNMNEPQNSAKYNPFSESSETMCKDMIVNMTDWSEEHYKSNAERYIQRLIKLLNLKNEKLSFNKIIEYISIDKFEMLSVELTKNNLITKEEHLSNLEIVKSSGKIAENASARFATIAESEIGEIFGENGIDIYTALANDTVILFILNPLKYPETSTALGRLVLIDAKQAISKLFGNTNRTFFILDEINVYASPVLIDLINKSRSAGVTCIPATQSLADLEIVAGEAFKQQIIENCNNYIVLRQNSFKSAEEWAKTLGTKETMQMTYQVSKEESTGLGTAKKVREFIVHPDEIKAQKTGTGIFLSRDDGKCERIEIVKPF